MLGGVIFRTDYETFPLARPSIHTFKDVYQFLFIFQSPCHLVVVSSAEVDHDVSVSKKKHHCHLVVQLVHCIEVRYLTDVDHIKNRKVLHHFRCLHKNFIHLHAQGIGIMTEADANDTILLRQNGLIDLPAII